MAIAPSSYYAHKAQPVSDSDLADAWMANTALDVWKANRSLYGADKLATAIGKAGHDIGRDQVGRLMKIVGIEGNTRGKHKTITTRRDPRAARHPDLIKRAWSTPVRPDQWWCADFTYVWTLSGFAYVSFITDVYSRRILGWRTSMSKTTPLVLSALEQALFTRRRHDARFSAHGVVHHSDAGSQGEFNRPSQHLDRGGVGWRRCGSASGRSSCIGVRSRLLGRRRWRGGRTGCGSGRRSLRERRPTMPRWRPGCHPPSRIGGSVTLAA
jgi:putative transposase